jgi:lipopolysaccharide export system protein LptA
VGGVAITYRVQRKLLEARAPAKPARMPADLKSLGQDWVWKQTEGDKPKLLLRARSFRQEKSSLLTELEGVELQIFSKTGESYNLVKCAKASFTQGERRLYSEGDVEIVMNLPAAGPPKRKPVSIRTSGLTYEMETGKAATERPSTFEFANGNGRSLGADYDPASGLLNLGSQVELTWKGNSPHAKPMKVEAGAMHYQEGSGKIFLEPWAKLTRENTVVQSENAVVTLENDSIRLVEATKGHGTDVYPNHKLEYSADSLWVDFSDHGVVEKVAAEPNAHLVNTSEHALTEVNAKRVEMEFNSGSGESVLTHVLATGDAVAESKPLPAADKPLPETRVMRAAVIDMKMRAGGKEVDLVEVPVPGTIEFVPNRPADRHRVLTGSHIWIAYGPQNHIQTFRTVDATTQSDPTPEERARKREPSKTSSKNLSAVFDPKTGQMSRMEQSEDFVYQEGDRNAKAARAVLEQDKNLITLETAARMWDSTGSTSADRIRMDQRTGNFQAEGHVSSSRLPDQKKPSSDLLAGDQPLQAVAERMQSANRNRSVHYQGKVVLWQGANRVKGEDVLIDREARRLTANGSVTTQFADEPKEEKGKPKAAPVFTEVRAQKLVYTEQDRLAHYTGGVVLSRPGLEVKGAALRAYLGENGAESRLERAFADGNVSIVQKAPLRTRVGTGEHAEYYTEDERIILHGGVAQLADSLRGNTRGAQLTYFADDDRLLVDGAPAQPASSRIRGNQK